MVVAAVRFAGPLKPLRHTQFRLLWTGMSASLIGDGMLLVALAWQVYDLFGVTSAMSAVGVALSLPQVATLLLGGVISDRFDPRRVMLVSDLVRGLVMATLAFLCITGTLSSLWLLLGLTAIYGAAAGFFGPSFDAVVPQLVREDDLVSANALDQFVRPAAMQIFGPMIGGAIIGLAGAGWAIAADAATFALSAACLLAMRRTSALASSSPEEVAGSSASGASADSSASGEEEEEAVSLWAELREGIGYVRTKVWLWGTFLSATFTYLLFVGPTEVLLPYVVKHDMGGSATQLSLILTSGGLGAIAAALSVGWVGVPRRFISFMYITWAVATLAVAGYGLGTHTWQLAVACVLVNGLEAAGTVAWATTKQRFVPAGMLGRVSSVDWFVSTALLPLSYALASPVAGWIGVRHTLLGAGVLGAVVTFGFMFLKGMRGPEVQEMYRPRHVYFPRHVLVGPAPAKAAPASPVPISAVPASAVPVSAVPVSAVPFAPEIAEVAYGSLMPVLLRVEPAQPNRPLSATRGVAMVWHDIEDTQVMDLAGLPQYIELRAHEEAMAA